MSKVAIALLAFWSLNAVAGPPTYKCVIGTRVEYSDAPCAGATVVDTTPTQGLNSLSGKPQIGRDVAREMHTRALATALYPLLGETTEQYKTRHRRAMLTPITKLECSMLDSRVTNPNSVNDAKLLTDRQRYRELNC